METFFEKEYLYIYCLTSDYRGINVELSCIHAQGLEFLIAVLQTVNLTLNNNCAIILFQERFPWF